MGCILRVHCGLQGSALLRDGLKSAAITLWTATNLPTQESRVSALKLASFLFPEVLPRDICLSQLQGTASVRPASIEGFNNVLPACHAAHAGSAFALLPCFIQKLIYHELLLQRNGNLTSCKALLNIFLYGPAVIQRL